MSAYDDVDSFSSGIDKAVRTEPRAVRVLSCCTPSGRTRNEQTEREVEK